MVACLGYPKFYVGLDYTKNMTTAFPTDLLHIILPFVVDKHPRKQELVIR